MFVGIDVSKDRLDVHVRPSGEAFAVARHGEGLDDLVGRLRALPAVLVVLEATGGYETVVAAALAAANLPLVVVNPRQIRDFARAAGQLAKTDRLDARIIARFAEAMRPEPRLVPDAAAQALGELVARRRQIVEMIGAENIVRGTPAWRDKEDLLKTVPGIGPTIARTLIAELPELGSLDRRKIASLAGLAPINRDSGTLRGRRTIAGGRATVRSALYMAVMVSIRHKLPLAQTYNHLRQSGKAPKAAITACMRKLVTILNAILRDQKPWATA